MVLRVIHIMDARGDVHVFAILVAPEGVGFEVVDDAEAVPALGWRGYAERETLPA